MHWSAFKFWMEGSGKRSKFNVLRENWNSNANEERKIYDCSLPYKHAVISPFDRDFLLSLKEEMLGLTTTFKETDLFRLNQTVDFANLSSGDSSCLGALKETLYSSSFRKFIEEVSGCSTLNTNVDCAGNIYSQGCHLGCHDDCISSRKISYILYLSDEEWLPEDGGSLELYSLTSYIPEKCILPSFGTLVFFEVDGGVSLHSVEEVYSSTKRRISIQGWFHTDSKIFQEKATITELTKEVDETSSKTVIDKKAAVSLSDWINPVYLTTEGRKRLQKALLTDKALILKDFILSKKISEFEKLIQSRDILDGFAPW